MCQKSKEYEYNLTFEKICPEGIVGQREKTSFEMKCVTKMSNVNAMSDKYSLPKELFFFQFKIQKILDCKNKEKKKFQSLFV